MSSKEQDAEDFKDQETFDQKLDNQNAFPRHYFDSVAERSQALEKERRLRDNANSERDDFVVSSNYPKFHDKHCFFDDDLDESEEESKVGSVLTKPLDGPLSKQESCQIEEIDEAAAVAEDSSPEKRPSAEEKQVQSLLQDFGFVKDIKEERKA